MKRSIGVAAFLAVTALAAGTGVAVVTSVGGTAVLTRSTSSDALVAPLVAPPGTRKATKPRAPKPTTSPSPTPSTKAKATTTATTPIMTDRIPAIPKVKATELGAIHQAARVAGRDNGQSALYGRTSVWIFDDTTLKNPWGFLSNSAASTTDLNAADGLTLTTSSAFGGTSATPSTLLPETAAEKSFEAAHASAGGCANSPDRYCGASFGFWPGPVISDPVRHRLLVFYGKLCRGGQAGTPCSGALGKGLGTGIAAVNMRTRTVTRLKVTGTPTVSSVEGSDPTMFFPDGQGWSSGATVVGPDAYVYGECALGCHLAKVPLSEITDRTAWRFWTGRSWSADRSRAVNTISPGSAGQTVFYDAALKGWLNLFMPYGQSTLMAQVGGSPSGPWSHPFTLARTAGTGNYAAYGHPELARNGGLTEYASYFQASTGAQRLVKLQFTP